MSNEEMIELQTLTILFDGMARLSDSENKKIVKFKDTYYDLRGMVVRHAELFEKFIEPYKIGNLEAEKSE